MNTHWQLWSWMKIIQHMHNLKSHYGEVWEEVLASFLFSRRWRGLKTSIRVRGHRLLYTLIGPSQNRSAYQHNRANVVAHISAVFVWCIWKSSIPITVSLCLVPIAMKNLGFPNLHTAKYLHPNRIIQQRLYLACFSFKLRLPWGEMTQNPNIILQLPTELWVNSQALRLPPYLVRLASNTALLCVKHKI